MEDGVQKNRIFREPVLVPLGCMVLLAIFAFMDLPISVRLYNPQSSWGRLFEVIGEMPAPLCAAFSGALLLLWTHKNRRPRRIVEAGLGALFWLAGSLTAAALPLDNAGVFTLPGAAGLGVLAAGLLFFAASRVLSRPEGQSAARSFAFLGILLFVSDLACFSLLKMLWGRARFWTLTGDSFAGFSPWYIPQGFSLDNAYMSFPSGHTAQGSMILVITLLPLLVPGLKKHARLLKGAAYLWIFLTAISRIIMGAHFASDVTAGFLITFCLFQFPHRGFHRALSNQQL
jgi:membrane-associated phospholipid phosphatase